MLQLFDKSRNSTSTLLYELCIISPLDVSGHILKNVLHFNCMDKLRNGQVSQDTTPRKCRKYHTRLNLSKNVLLKPLLQSDTPLLFVIGHTRSPRFFLLVYIQVNHNRASPPKPSKGGNGTSRDEICVKLKSGIRPFPNVNVRMNFQSKTLNWHHLNFLTP